MSQIALRFLAAAVLLTTTCQGTALGTVPNTTVPPSPSVAPTLPSAAPSADATYYVSTDGDDGDDGSAGTPWRTLQHAANQVAPGDTILVLSGTYQGLRIERSGAPGAWIALRAAPGAQVVVNAPGPDNRHDSNVEVETWEGAGVVAYWVIEGLEVSNAPNWGIDLRGSQEAKSHHITVRGNRVHHNGLSGGETGIFAAFVDDLLVEDNQSYANGEHGVYVNNSSDRFTVRGNRLHDNAGCGLHLNGDVEQGGDGILSNGLVENNVIYGNGVEGGAAINMDGVADTVVRNNLIYGNHATGIALFQENGAICSRDNRLLNNTILVPGDGRWAVLLGAATCTGNQVRNNILYSDHSYRGSINLPTPQVPGLQSDYNVVVDRFTTDDSESVISLAEWQALGYDVHSIQATPAELFVDPAGHDYHLQPGSPAVDAGTTLAEVGADLEGHPRPAGAAFDIGAYEYGDAGTQATTFLPLVMTTPDRSAGPSSVGAAGSRARHTPDNNIWLWSPSWRPPRAARSTEMGVAGAKPDREPTPLDATYNLEADGEGTH